MSVVVTDGEINSIFVPVAALRRVPAERVKRLLVIDDPYNGHVAFELEHEGTRYTRDENTPEIIDGEAVYWRLPDGFGAITAVVDSVRDGILVDGRFWEISA
jgi:hypothetical protein